MYHASNPQHSQSAGGSVGPDIVAEGTLALALAPALAPRS